MVSAVPIRMPNPDYRSVRILDDLAALYAARGYLREFLHTGSREIEGVVDADKDLTQRIGKPAAKKKVKGEDTIIPGAGKLLEWQEVRDKKWAVQAWRGMNDDALPPLAPRSVHVKLPGLRANLSANGKLSLYTTPDGKTVNVGDAVVVKPHLEGDVNYAGRIGRVQKIVLTDVEDAAKLKDKEVKDFKGASIVIKTDNGSTYAGKVDRFGPIGNWTPHASKTPDPDARETRVNASWFRQPELIAPWRLLAQLVVATARYERCEKDHQNAPNSEDVFMFFKAAEEHLERVRNVWTRWATQHPLEADKCIRLHETSMQTAELEVPVPEAATDYSGSQGQLDPVDPNTHWRATDIARKNDDAISGYVHGILADGIINDHEISGLSNLLSQSEVNTPGRDLLVAAVKKWQQTEGDNRPADHRNEDLMGTLQKYAGTDLASGELMRTNELPLDDPPPEVDPRGNFVFTGTFACGSKAMCRELTEKNGGTFLTALSNRVDYLVLGTYVTPSWKHTSHGLKIADAVRKRDEKGIPIKIVSEQHWLASLDNEPDFTP